MGLFTTVRGPLDSVSLFCMRYPQFCAELAAELGGAALGGGLGLAGDPGMPPGPGFGGGGGRIVRTIRNCIASPMGPAKIGKAAHNILGRFMGSDGRYRINQTLRGTRLRPDAQPAALGEPNIEFKPGSFSGIAKGLSQGRKYEDASGVPTEIVPYPVPWAPEYWDKMPDWFRFIIPLSRRP
jgi:hypothetical protein